MDFHISRLSRDRYQFDQGLFSYNGNAILANFHAARTFSRKINEKRDLVNFPETAVKAGQINAMGLIDEILHHVLHLYQEEKNPEVFSQALKVLDKLFTKTRVDQMLLQFLAEFPPVDVYLNKTSPEKYLAASIGSVSNRSTTLEELVLLRITNENPAMQPYDELFNDSNLIRDTIYTNAFHELRSFFETQPRFGPDNLTLIDLLRSPALASPYSLDGQLEFIRERWAMLLGQFLYRLLSSLDFIKEEAKLSMLGPGIVEIPVYARHRGGFGLEDEIERFSLDRDWMPQLVLLAKNSFVWLHQLSVKYKLKIERLDQIPDEELDRIASSGFSGLWLIGLWERSHASARIKQMCGNPDAIASAYSLYDYQIAASLGGESAYQNLKNRAALRGIRLASDMVPNHMGIDSPWVNEHPDWFLSLDYQPFPSHSFNGPNLSRNPNVGIYVEDHYFDRTDAAVEFKRVDFNSGDTRYIYHGNDGTSMPWNDTAQLNYLNPVVREAVIQTILEVARKFPIIRFDAAMTLAKKHFQRLWFPEPGTGGAIPTRSDFGLTKAQFDELMPEEFWREVVDRVAKETPDTLLLAEAFWLMEGYFVRTLGMHRVYNSAFMHMLRNEDNAGYRQLIKNTLEFDPEILKRYVNFMNNPDERTAVDQFGKGDKYFGICMLMSTLPGLPMFGHGQVEGFAEKYGMEFTKPLWQESEDEQLVKRHQKLIFPLLHQRDLFAGVENFQLYDFYTSSGQVDENVFAFSNHHEGKSALILYNNKFSRSSGWLRMSCGKVKKLTGDKRRIEQKNLAENLRIVPGLNTYTIFRDHISGLEYIRSSSDIYEKGLPFTLEAYQFHVFLEFHQVKEDRWKSYGQLCAALDGRGVPSIELALLEMNLQPVLNPLQQLFNPGYFNYLLANRVDKPGNKTSTILLDEFSVKIRALLQGAAELNNPQISISPVIQTTRRSLELILTLRTLENNYPHPPGKKYRDAFAVLEAPFLRGDDSWLSLFSWSFLAPLGYLAVSENRAEQTLSWMDEWQLNRQIEKTLLELGKDRSQVTRNLQTIRILILQQRWFERTEKSPRKFLENWLSNPDIQHFLGVNRYQDILWFNKESFEEFISWMNIIAVINLGSTPGITSSEILELMYQLLDFDRQFKRAIKKSQYRLQNLLQAL